MNNKTNNKSQKQMFWASFLPAIAYWYLEENYTLQIALAGGLALAVLEMSVEWILTKHIHTLSKLNFYLILILGGIAFIAQEGVWFKLQPFFTGFIMGGYLLFRIKKKDSLMLEMMKSFGNEEKAALVEPSIVYLEKHMSFFLILYGIFMGYMAIWGSTDQWLFFKTIGFYIAMGLFIIVEMIFIRKQALAARRANI